MSQAVFPSLAGLTWNIGRSVILNTVRQRAVSGREIALRYQAYPLYRFSLNFEFLRDTVANPDFDTLVAFILERQASYDTFLFSDWADNAVTDSNFGTGNGSNKIFQLSRTFGAGGFTVAEPVQNVQAITNVKVNGVTKVNPTDYTIDANGLITFVVAPGNALPVTWTGTYYYRCRIDQDETEVNNFAQGFWDLNQFDFVGAPGNRV